MEIIDEVHRDHEQLELIEPVKAWKGQIQNKKMTAQFSGHLNADHDKTPGNNVHLSHETFSGSFILLISVREVIGLNLKNRFGFIVSANTQTGC